MATSIKIEKPQADRSWSGKLMKLGPRPSPAQDVYEVELNMPLSYLVLALS